MCRRVECAACKKPSYAGCGMHIEQVLGDVPREARCKCRETPKDTSKKVEEGAREPSALRRFFGL